MLATPEFPFVKPESLDQHRHDHRGVPKTHEHSLRHVFAATAVVFVHAIGPFITYVKYKYCSPRVRRSHCRLVAAGPCASGQSIVSRTRSFDAKSKYIRTVLEPISQ